MQPKSFDFAPGTRLLYFLAVVTLVLLGGIFILVGVASVLEQPERRIHRTHRQQTEFGIVLAVAGIALIAGAAAPFRGWKRSGRSRVLLTDDELIFEEAGDERRVAWRDIADLSEVGTSLELVLRDRQGSLLIPRSFENFDELIEEIRTRARVRPGW